MKEIMSAVTQYLPKSKRGYIGLFVLVLIGAALWTYADKKASKDAAQVEQVK